MEILKQESGRTGKFFILEDNNEVADIGWLINDENNIVIDHTTVSDHLSGQGIGLKLLEEVILFARSTDKKIIPNCPYAHKMFQRHADHWEDVWDKRENV